MYHYGQSEAPRRPKPEERPAAPAAPLVPAAARPAVASPSPEAELVPAAPLPAAALGVSPEAAGAGAAELTRLPGACPSGEHAALNAA